ncbi:CLUMA_CG013181, isoform A [Clunio marinus]|uniref:CLUMA_CG013181, isoform A n=1 Tax=Clunio marinus TaxID=568069 RepID=A0A1J1II00_9DIPT|nr:CLUMA_CG013181, isoform A [Clunio marinus]
MFLNRISYKRNDIGHVEAWHFPKLKGLNSKSFPVCRCRMVLVFMNEGNGGAHQQHKQNYFVVDIKYILRQRSKQY